MAIETTKKEIENKTESITHSLSLVTISIVLLCISQSSDVFSIFSSSQWTQVKSGKKLVIIEDDIIKNILNEIIDYGTVLQSTRVLEIVAKKAIQIRAEKMSAKRQQ